MTKQFDKFSKKMCELLVFMLVRSLLSTSQLYEIVSDHVTRFFYVSTDFKLVLKAYGNSEGLSCELVPPGRLSGDADNKVYFYSNHVLGIDHCFDTSDDDSDSSV